MQDEFINFFNKFDFPVERQRSILEMVGNGFDAEFVAKNLILPLDAVQKVIDSAR